MWSQIEEMVRAFEQGSISRRELVGGLGAAALAMTGVREVAAAEGKADEPTTFSAVGLNHIALRVTNVDRSAEWYKKHLGWKDMSVGRSRFLSVGPDFLALFPAEQARMDHYCYSVPGYDAGAAIKKLEAAGLKPRRRENRVYFDDPDGLEVQVAAPNHE